MRIIAGKVKGYRLKTVKGLPVRPTTELVRGAIFSILESLPQEWGVVLDLYAGSGALGMEALSRGAVWADFVEQNRACCTLLKENLSKTSLSTQAHVLCCKVEKALTFLNKQYNIIFMDPPYSEPILDRLLEKLAPSPLLASDALVVIPRSTHIALQDTHGSLRLTKERRHGDTVISIYRKEKAEL